MWELDSVSPGVALVNCHATCCSDFACAFLSFASSQKAKKPLILELRNLHAAESSHCISFAQFARCIL